MGGTTDTAMSLATEISIGRRNTSSLRLAAAIICLAGLVGCAPRTLHVAGVTHPGDLWLQPSGGPEGHGAAEGRPVPPMRLQWRQKAGKPPVGGPLMDGRLLLQLTGESRIVAYDLASGTRVGRRTFTEDWCAPLAAAGQRGNLLIASLAGDEPQVRAFDRIERKWRWRSDLASCTAPVVRGDTVVVATETGAVVALSAETGEELWQWHGTGLYAAGPSWRARDIWVGDIGGRVTRLDAATGQALWEVDLGAGIRACPTPTSGSVCVVTAASEVVDLDADTGQVRWRRRLDGLLTGTAAGDDVLIVASSDFGVYGLSPVTGEVLWRHDTGGVVRGAPVRAGPIAYVAGGGAALQAIDVLSGALVWEWPLDAPVAAPVAVGSALVAVTTQRGTIYLFSGASP